MFVGTDGDNIIESTGKECLAVAKCHRKLKRLDLMGEFPKNAAIFARWKGKRTSYPYVPIASATLSASEIVLPKPQSHYILCCDGIPTFKTKSAAVVTDMDSWSLYLSIEPWLTLLNQFVKRWQLFFQSYFSTSFRRGKSKPRIRNRIAGLNTLVTNPRRPPYVNYCANGNVYRN